MAAWPLFYKINRTLHGRLGIRIWSSRAESISHSFASLTRERYFQYSKIKFVSPSGHVISSIYFILNSISSVRCNNIKTRTFSLSSILGRALLSNYITWLAPQHRSLNGPFRTFYFNLPRPLRMSCLLFWRVANFDTFQTLVFSSRFLGKKKGCNLYYFIFFNWTLNLKL